MSDPSIIAEDRAGHRSKTTAMVIAAVAIVFVVAIGIVIRHGLRALAREDCGYNLVQIGLRCREYAAEHEGHFPSTWVELNFVGEDANWAKLLRCPLTGHAVGRWPQVDLWADYRLLPQRSTNDSPDTVLAVEPLANHRSTGAHVLFVDGSSQWWSASRMLERGKNLR